jgi:hypothetical protein
MAATFKVGDKVAHRTFGAGEVAFGPFEHNSGRDTYLLKEEGSERHTLVIGEALSPAAKFTVGDEVRSGSVRYAVTGGPFRGPAHIWYAITKDGVDYQSNESYLSLVEAAPASTHTHDGITYDLTAGYRDTDNDVWKFKFVGGEVRGTYTRRSVEEWDETLAAVVRSYGPLTRV